MAGTLNRFQGIGRLDKDIEPVLMPSDTLVVNGGIATTQYWYEDNEKKEQTNWHNFVAWGQMAERIANLEIKKGTLIYIEGPMKTRSWEKDGHRNYKTECHIRDIQILSSKSEVNSMHLATSTEEPHDDMPFQPDDLPIGDSTQSLGNTRDAFHAKVEEFKQDAEEIEASEVVENKGKSQTGSPKETGGIDRSRTSKYL